MDEDLEVEVRRVSCCCRYPFDEAGYGLCVEVLGGGGSGVATTLYGMDGCIGEGGKTPVKNFPREEVKIRQRVCFYMGDVVRTLMSMTNISALNWLSGAPRFSAVVVPGQSHISRGMRVL